MLSLFYPDSNNFDGCSLEWILWIWCFQAMVGDLGGYLGLFLGWSLYSLLAEVDFYFESDIQLMFSFKAPPCLRALAARLVVRRRVAK